MPTESQSAFTHLLTALHQGDHAATADLLSLVYAQLRAMAQQKLNRERVDHTLEATALVHEAYLRLAGDQPVPWSNRAHFVAAAAEAMRRILIEHARSRGRQKRGGERKRQMLNVLDLAIEQDSDEIMALDAAIRRFEEQDPRAAQVVRLRFFAGLSIDDTAAALDLSPRTVKRDWEIARAWLYQAMGEDDNPGSTE